MIVGAMRDGTVSVDVESGAPGPNAPSRERINAPIPFQTAFQLFGNKVIIWQPKAPLAVLIEDEYIVQMLKSIFFIMWEKAGIECARG